MEMPLVQRPNIKYLHPSPDCLPDVLPKEVRDRGIFMSMEEFSLSGLSDGIGAVVAG